MGLLLKIVNSPLKALGLISLGLLASLLLALERIKTLNAQLAAKPKVEYRERVRIHEKIVERREPNGSSTIETTRDTGSERENKEEPTQVATKKRFVGLERGNLGYLGIDAGMELGDFQLSAGGFRFQNNQGLTARVADKF